MLQKENLLIYNEAWLVVREANDKFKEGWEVVPKSIILKKGPDKKMYMVVLLERYLDDNEEVDTCVPD